MFSCLDLEQFLERMKAHIDRRVMISEKAVYGMLTRVRNVHSSYREKYSALIAFGTMSSKGVYLFPRDEPKEKERTLSVS